MFLASFHKQGEQHGVGSFYYNPFHGGAGAALPSLSTLLSEVMGAQGIVCAPKFSLNKPYFVFTSYGLVFVCVFVPSACQ